MGSLVEINDTLQLTKKQGFPIELNLEQHLKAPLKADDFTGRLFEFNGKEGIRIYHLPPVRNFLVENREGKWIYWGIINILEVRHNYVDNTTSGKFKLLYLYNPTEMKKAHDLIDRREEKKFFIED